MPLKGVFVLVFLGVVLCAVPGKAQESVVKSHAAEGAKAFRRGDYASAEKAFSAAVKEAERIGPESTLLATNLNNLGALYKIQGKLSQAVPVFQRAIAIREKALGADHPQVANSLNNLAVVYKTQGNL